MLNIETMLQTTHIATMLLNCKAQYKTVGNYLFVVSDFVYLLNASLFFVAKFSIFPQLIIDHWCFPSWLLQCSFGNWLPEFCSSFFSLCMVCIVCSCPFFFFLVHRMQPATCDLFFCPLFPFLGVRISFR